MQSVKFFLVIMLAALLFASGSAVAYSGIQAVMGEDVPISGYATSGPYVYLFLTGPNLPENGVTLNDIYKRADQGYFTKVSVEGDDQWSYTWHTGSIVGRLDEGTYTVWVVSGPNDRSNLARADYRTIPVTLGKPTISVNTPALPGTMDLKSVPDDASVTVAGEYRGKTPLVISSLPPGQYMVTFSKFGYEELTTQVSVQAGSRSEVSATLQPKTGSLSVSSIPAGARVMLDGIYAGNSPVVLPNISADRHTVGLEMDGYAAVTRDVSIVAGQENPVVVTLAPVAAPVTPSPTRAAGLVPATACAFILIAGTALCRNRSR